MSSPSVPGPTVRDVATEEDAVPGVRVLVGTRKGAFVLTSDEGRRQWQVDGPHFGGWEVMHVKGSPVDPDLVWARPREAGSAS
jgi:hypothetical protein